MATDNLPHSPEAAVPRDLVLNTPSTLLDRGILAKIFFFDLEMVRGRESVWCVCVFSLRFSSIKCEKLIWKLGGKRRWGGERRGEEYDGKTYLGKS